jgi:hypothetical protein
MAQTPMTQMIKHTVLSLLSFLIILSACRPEGENPLNDPLVSVGDKILTKGDLFQVIPDNIPPDDSTIFAQDYINRWIRAELMLRKAELNLNPEEKDVQRLLEEYRRSLLVHQYQQKMLEQKYSPLITSSEIKRYYEEMLENFKLAENIIKGIFVIVPRTAPNLNDLRRWYRSNNNEDLVKMEAYCYQNAKKYEVFLEEWYSLDQINARLPRPISRPEQYLKYNKSYETSDSLYHYFVSIHDYKLESDIAPLEYTENKIKAILLNKKRLDFINQLETDLYDEGLKQKVITFY